MPGRKYGGKFLQRLRGKAGADKIPLFFMSLQNTPVFFFFFALAFSNSNVDKLIRDVVLNSSVCSFCRANLGSSTPQSKRIQ